jgi:pimeloyl-ACP methyl ester carboxylesterase
MILVGHSVGAILAARLALLSNETLGARVRGLVLIAPAAFLPRVKGKKAGWKGGKGKGVADGKGVEGEGGGEMYGRGGGWESGNDGGVADWEGGGGVSEEGEERTAVTAGRAAGGAVAVGYSETGYSEVDPTAPSPPSFARRPRRALSRLASSVTARLLRLFLFLPLRLAVRAIIGSEAFWRRGLGNAYRDTFRLTDDMVRAVTAPLRTSPASPPYRISTPLALPPPGCRLPPEMAGARVKGGKECVRSRHTNKTPPLPPGRV